jgi:hypothetical protein
MRVVTLAQGGYALVIRIPRSYNPPHRIVRQGAGQFRFYARSSAGKYEPNVDELRLLFNRAPQLADRIRDFRFDRIAKVVANNAQVPLLDSHALIIHIVPLSAFDTVLPLPLGQYTQWYTAFSPIISNYPSDGRINVDGLLTLSNAQPGAKAHRAYVQLFHNGIVEAVASSFLMGDRADRLTAMKTEASIVKYSHAYLTGLLSLGSEPPFALLASLVGVQGVLYSFTMGHSLFEDEASTLDRDQFHFGEMIIDDVPTDPSEYAKLLRPLLNQIANAGGRAMTPTFDHNGNFKLKVD